MLRNNRAGQLSARLEPYVVLDTVVDIHLCWHLFSEVMSPSGGEPPAHRVGKATSNRHPCNEAVFQTLPIWITPDQP
jgi:hypothetical protein